MKRIELKSRTNLDWAGKWMHEDCYDSLVNETCEIFQPDGSRLAVLLKGALLNDEFKKLHDILKKHRWTTNNRGTAAGTGYIKKVKEDGTVSKTWRSTEVESGIIGFYERTPRFPYCRSCAFNLNHPEDWKGMLPTFQLTSDLFGHYVSDRYKIQRDIVDRTNKDFVIPGTIFTTITVNRNFQTACHKDAGDLENGFTCMSVATEGKFAGGNLVFPDFKIAVKLEHGDLIFFQPHEFHGNTPIRPMTKQYARWSMVHYYRTKIQHCRTHKEELNRVKHRKQGESLT